VTVNVDFMRHADTETGVAGALHVAVDGVGIRGEGGASVLEELLRWLPERRPTWRWTVFLLSERLRHFPLPAFNARKVHVRLVNAGSGTERLKWAWFGAQRESRRAGADVLFALANVGSPIPVLPQVVFVQQAAGFTPNTARRGLRRKLRDAVLSRLVRAGVSASRACVVQTPEMARAVKKTVPAAAGRVVVVPSGYRSHYQSENVGESVRAVFSHPNECRLFYPSLTRPHKNHETLISALPLILATHPNVVLLLTEGEPDPFDLEKDRIYRNLVAQAQALGVTDRIRWVGWLNKDEVTFGLRAASLMVFPSVLESFGLPLAEAIGADAKICAADLPYAREVAGDAAVYFEAQNPEDLARAVREALTPDVASHLAMARSVRLPLFDYRNIAESLAMIVERCAG
jgi:glycosyltransferase involved in cell wall biosynthesis